MEKLLVLLLALMPGCSKTNDSGKLGSSSDPIRQMLFANRSLTEQVSRLKLNGHPGPLQTLAGVLKLVQAGKKQESIVHLSEILETPYLETRVILWTWSALRESGKKPDPKLAYQVLGVVIEMPSGGAYDMLAAYQNGSARYLNFSGAAIIWDAKDATIKSLCKTFIDSAISASTQAKPRAGQSLAQ